MVQLHLHLWIYWPFTTLQNFILFRNFTSQVRDELEHLLDDDNDMAEMYLTEKLVEQIPLKEESCDEALEDDDEGWVLMQ